MSGVDVVIATRDRPDSLRATLTALARQTFRRFRVTIVDDGSETPVEVAPELARQFELQVIRMERSVGPAAARNAGVEAGAGELIAFLDDDVRPARRWLETHLARLAGEAPGTVSIGPLAAPPDWQPTPWNRWEARTLAVEYRRILDGEYRPTARQFFTGNAVVPRDRFVAAGGFDPRFKRAEDVELALRLEREGCCFVFEPEAVGWHYAHRTLKSWIAIPRQYAEYDALIAAKYGPRWLRMVDRELKRRNRLSRAYMSVANQPLAGRAATLLAVGAGVAMSRGPVMAAGQSLLSLAWQGEYVRRLNRLRAEGAGSAAPA